MKKFSALLLAVVTALCLCSCEKEKERYSAYYFDFFDTATTIVGYADSKEEFDAVCGDIKKQLHEYHRLYTIYNRYEGLNNLYTINTEKDAVKVDERIIDLLEYSKEAYTLTEGNTNVAMGAVLSIWHTYRSEGMDNPKDAKLPPMDKLSEASKHTSIEDVIIDRESSTVTLADEKMSLDVGAVAKGYATEMVARSLEEKGIEGYILNVGGNVRTIGNRPSGEKWTVGIENPNATGEEDAYLAYLKLSGESVVTSGSYQRYYLVNGERYHHIIDKDTLMPGTDFQSVSVVCPDSGLGDALSTALFSMSYEEGSALIESMEGVEALWVLPSGEVKRSVGFGKYES